MSKQISNEKELELLRAKVAELEAEKIIKEESGDSNYLKEMREIRSKNAKGAGHITYKDIHDHKNIALYHINGFHIGKIVGPIHPENAEQYFNTFLQKGIKLSIHKPSVEFIEKYKKSAEFIKFEQDFNKKRALKRKNKGKDAVEELTKIIAKQQGVDPSKLNSIKSQEEVLAR